METESQLLLKLGIASVFGGLVLALRAEYWGWKMDDFCSGRNMAWGMGGDQIYIWYPISSLAFLGTFPGRCCVTIFSEIKLLPQSILRLTHIHTRMAHHSCTSQQSNCNADSALSTQCCYSWPTHPPHCLQIFDITWQDVMSRVCNHNRPSIYKRYRLIRRYDRRWISAW